VGHTAHSPLDEARDKPRMAGPPRVEDAADPSRMLDFQSTTAAWIIFLAGCKYSPNRFFRGLQVEPEPRPRRGANGLAVARFPNEQPVFREYSVHCQDYKIMVRTARSTLHS